MKSPYCNRRWHVLCVGTHHLPIILPRDYKWIALLIFLAVLCMLAGCAYDSDYGFYQIPGSCHPNPASPNYCGRASVRAAPSYGGVLIPDSVDQSTGKIHYRVYDP